MFKTTSRALAALTLALTLPTLAHAHPAGASGEAAGGLVHGFVHPFSGLDHILAMLAVGLWASQLKGRALWALPAAFIGAMMLGGAIGMSLGVSGVGTIAVEQGIVFSVLALGVLVAAAVRMPVAAGAGIAALFALFHGFAHGAEMPASVTGLEYSAGFVLATAILHSCGIVAGTLMQRPVALKATRFAGVAVAVGGALLMVS